MTPSQAEMLLRMAENTYVENDELLANVARQMQDGARRVLADEEYLMKAWEVNQRDKARFANYMAKPAEAQQNVGQGALQGGRQEGKGLEAGGWGRPRNEQRLAVTQKAENGG